MKKYRTISKKYCIFALSFDQDKFLILLCVVFLFATTVKAENINRQPLSGYCTKVSVIVLVKAEKGCLSLYSKFNNKNFSVMTKTLKNADGSKYPDAREACDNGIVATHSGTLPQPAKSGYKALKSAIVEEVLHELRAAVPQPESTKPPKLNLSGISSNPYLYALRKSFREFLLEESKGYTFTELRLKGKIDAARQLFPEGRVLLNNLTERRLYV